MKKPQLWKYTSLCNIVYITETVSGMPFNSDRLEHLLGV